MTLWSSALLYRGVACRAIAGKEIGLASVTNIAYCAQLQSTN